MTWSRKGDRGVKGCSAKDQKESTAESSKPSGGGGRGAGLWLKPRKLHFTLFLPQFSMQNHCTQMFIGNAESMITIG